MNIFKSKVLLIALPLILSNVTVPLLGLVDTAVVGHLAHAYFVAAVGVGAVVFDFIYWGFGFLRQSTTGIIAQAAGRKDAQAIRDAFVQASFLAIVIAVALLLLQYPIAKLAFFLIHPDAVVQQYAENYFFVRIWAAPATLMVYVLNAWFIGRHQTRNVFYLMLIMNIVGMILDFWFVFGLHMNSAGVALATAIAVYVGFFAGLLMFWKSLKGMPGHFQWVSHFKGEQFKRFMHMNKDMFIRTLCLMFSFAFFTHMGAMFGKVILAANVVLFNFQNVMAYALDGFATAAEALVGKAVGRTSKEELIHTAKQVFIWAAFIALFAVLIYALFGRQIINLITTIPSVRESAYQYLFFVIISPIISVWGFMYDGIFIGATWSKQMRNTMIISLLVFLVFAYSLISFGNNGLWLAFLIFMATRGLTMTWVFIREIKRF